MEKLSILAGGADELRQMGWEYLMCFLDWFPDAPQLNPAVDIMLPEEREAVAEVLHMISTSQPRHGVARQLTN